MEEFGTSPDIDEKAPIPLRDALEKMKPFLMAYEGIQSQEEWEVKLVPTYGSCQFKYIIGSFKLLLCVLN